LILPTFYRIVALAEPPQTGTGKGQWLSPEILSMFLFHHMRSLSHQVITFSIIEAGLLIQIQINRVWIQL
jgi:hypothetical protein